MKLAQLILVILLSIAVSAGTFVLMRGKAAESGVGGKVETTAARVVRTGEIRCAYALYAPTLMKDPQTGKFSGIFYDVMEEVGRRLSLKISWNEEVGYGNAAEGFATNRYDALCATLWPTPERSRAASFTIPLYYSPVDVIVRAGDHRFDGNLSKLNDPSYTFAVKDGDITDTFANQFFPKAKHSSIPDLADASQLMVDVVSGKADAVINAPDLFYQYLDKNPGTLRDLTTDQPLMASPNTIMIPPDQYQFKVMLDTTLQGMISSGFIEQEMAKYKSYHPAYLRTALPYQPGRTDSVK